LQWSQRYDATISDVAKSDSFVVAVDPQNGHGLAAAAVTRV
jgi:hypothetical protein